MFMKGQLVNGSSSETIPTIVPATEEPLVEEAGGGMRLGDGLVPPTGVGRRKPAAASTRLSACLSSGPSRQGD